MLLKFPLPKALKVQISPLRARAVSNPGEPRTVTEDWGLGISPVSLGTCTVNFHLYIQMYRAYATSQGVLGRRINRTGKKKTNKINYNKLHMQIIKGLFCWQVDEPITGGGGVKSRRLGYDPWLFS